MDKSRIQEGFIILKANGQDVKTVAELETILQKATSTVKLEGVFLVMKESILIHFAFQVVINKRKIL